jgi:hypothetical protein
LLTLPAGTINANSGNEFALFSSSSPNSINVGATGNSSSAVPVTFTDVVTATLNGVDPTIDLAADLDITGDAFNIGNSFAGDFSDTATITYTAPPGVTVLSASGVFPAPVPEPASLALLGGALAGFGLIRRRKQCNKSSTGSNGALTGAVFRQSGRKEHAGSWGHLSKGDNSQRPSRSIGL